jgi:hypothetical protein
LNYSYTIQGLIVNDKELGLICQGNLDYGMYGTNGVDYGLKESILNKDKGLFLSGKKK